MNISAAVGTSAVSAAAPQTVVVAKKALDQQKLVGQIAIALIESAAPPLRAGQSLSVYA